MLAFKSKSNQDIISFIEYEVPKSKNQFTHSRTDSAVTLVEPLFKLLNFPAEILVMIAMRAGFITAMKLKQTCSTYRAILENRANWKDYATLSTDVLEIMVTMDTTLHPFDQISFCTWPVNGIYSPCLLHLTFSGHYDFLGGVSFTAQGRNLRPEFFESRDRLNCSTLDIDHSCSECNPYDNQKIEKTCFVNSPSVKMDHFYHVNKHLDLKVVVQSTTVSLGYSGREPSLTIEQHKLDGVKMTPRMRTLYSYFTQ